jgi:hypothetical protein
MMIQGFQDFPEIVTELDLPTMAFVPCSFELSLSLSPFAPPIPSQALHRLMVHPSHLSVRFRNLSLACCTLY